MSTLAPGLQRLWNLTPPQYFLLEFRIIRKSVSATNGEDASSPVLHVVPPLLSLPCLSLSLSLVSLASFSPASSHASPFSSPFVDYMSIDSRPLHFPLQSPLPSLLLYIYIYYICLYLPHLFLFICVRPAPQLTLLTHSNNLT